MGAAVDEQLEDEISIAAPAESQSKPPRRASIVSVRGKDIDEKDLDRGAA